MAEHFPLAGKKIFVAGHRGMVGSALVRQFQRLDAIIIVADRSQVDLMRQAEVETFLSSVKPDAVVIAAAKVGGILANDSFPVEFLYNNVMIEFNLIEAAHRANINRLLFLGSSCIYPKFAPQPIEEGSLLTGPLEPTNQWYAVAKIAGIKLCEAYRRQFGRDYISAMPTNLYGPGDNFDLKSGHVLPALIRKAHEAKLANSEEMTIWGTGAPRREFLHVDDCASALGLLLSRYSEDEHINVGSGADVTILELAREVAKAVGFQGKIITDASKPDGTPRKLMSGAKLAALGWKPSIPLAEGIASTYQWFLQSNPSELR